MSKFLTVTLERKNYTWDGQRWYGTEDLTVPTFGTMLKLKAMIPPEPPAKPKRPVEERT